MKELFESLKLLGETAVRELVTNKAQETLQLEFKLKRDASHGRFEKEDKLNLCKELSALSNSMGGLLIWGVDARKNADQIDCAVGLEPISELARFQATILGEIAQAIQPTHSEIEVLPIPSASSTDAGYLALLIGRSDRRPHRAEGPKDKNYYKRSGTSSVPMEHFDIEDAFLRRRSPVVTLAWKMHPYIDAGHAARGITLQIVNDSSVAARFPWVALKMHAGSMVCPYGLDGNSRFGLREKPNMVWKLFAGGSDDIVHPNLNLDVLRIRPTKGFVGPFGIDYKVGALDAPTNEGQVTIDHSDIPGRLQTK